VLSFRVVPPLETARLTLQPLEFCDAEQIQLLFADWEIVRYLTASVPWPYPADGAATWCRNALRAIERGDAWHWTLRLKTHQQQVIGVISLMKNDDNNRGFWIGRPWQGMGLMTEAVNAVTDYWFNTLEFPVLRVPKATANIRSRRISERSGMRVVKTFEHNYVGGRLPAEMWEITATEWNARR